MFSKRLKHLRENAGWTQKQLAKKLNLTQSTIAYYENDRKKPTLENAKVIAELFDISLDYLFGISNKNILIAQEDKKSYSAADNLIEEINNLSPKSLEDLKSYMKLLKLRDRQSRNNDNSD